MHCLYRPFLIAATAYTVVTIHSEFQIHMLTVFYTDLLTFLQYMRMYTTICDTHKQTTTTVVLVT
jgi:hypothetical protein